MKFMNISCRITVRPSPCTHTFTQTLIHTLHASRPTYLYSQVLISLWIMNISSSLRLLSAALFIEEIYWFGKEFKRKNRNLTLEIFHTINTPPFFMVCLGHRSVSTFTTIYSHNIGFMPFHVFNQNVVFERALLWGCKCSKHRTQP